MSNPNLQKHTLNLRRGDWDYLESIYQPHGVATSEVIRTLIRKFVDNKKAAANDQPPLFPELDHNL